MAYTRVLVLLAIFTLCQACSLSDHPVAHSKLGKPSSLETLEKLVDVPGPIEVETVNSADWTVPSRPVESEERRRAGGASDRSPGADSCLRPHRTTPAIRKLSGRYGRI